MISESVPWSALISVFVGICVSSVSGMNLPWILTSTSPLTRETLNVLPSAGEPGAGALAVVNVMSGPNVVPPAFVATSRTWYSAFGTSPETDADTTWLAKSDPTLCAGVEFV